MAEAEMSLNLGDENERNIARKTGGATGGTSTDPLDFLQNFYGGVLAEDLGIILSKSAAASSNLGRKSSITIGLSVEPMATTNGQVKVNITAKLNYKVPTADGILAQEKVKQSQFYVGYGGKLSLNPPGQGIMFDRSQAPHPADLEKREEPGSGSI